MSGCISIISRVSAAHHVGGQGLEPPDEGGAVHMLRPSSCAPKGPKLVCVKRCQSSPVGKGILLGVEVVDFFLQLMTSQLLPNRSSAHVVKVGYQDGSSQPTMSQTCQTAGDCRTAGRCAAPEALGDIHLFSTHFYTRLTAAQAANGMIGWENVKGWTKKTSWLASFRLVSRP